MRREREMMGTHCPPDSAGSRHGRPTERSPERIDDTGFTPVTASNGRNGWKAGIGRMMDCRANLDDSHLLDAAALDRPV